MSLLFSLGLYSLSHTHTSLVKQTTRTFLSSRRAFESIDCLLSMPPYQTNNAMEDSAMNDSAGSNLIVDWNFNPTSAGPAAPTGKRDMQGKIRGVKKRVDFDPNASYRVVEHYSAFSPREMSSVWYQEAEFDDFRKDIKRSARAMAKGQQEGIEIVRSRSNPELGSGTSRTRVYCYRGKSFCELHQR